MRKIIQLEKMRNFIAQRIVKPEVIFALVATTVGLILIFLVPPMQAPDEQTHFFQSYAVSNFDFVPDEFNENGKVHYGSKLPVSVYDSAINFREEVAGKPSVKFNTQLFEKYIDEPLRPELTKYVDGTTYAPFVYIPQALGISVGKLFETSPLIMIWVGRFLNLLVWILIIFLAVKIIPFGKWIMVVLALNPVVVFLSASLSADVLTIGLAFLFFALVASTLQKGYKITKLMTVALIGVISLLVLTKPVSIILVLLMFIIPRKVFTRRWSYVLFCISALLVMACLYLTWSSLSSDAAHAISQLQRPGFGVDSSAQLAHILGDPLNYIKSLLLNYVFVLPGYPGDAVLRSAIGSFGWLDTFIPLWTVVTYVLLLVFVVLYEAGRGLSLTLYQRMALILVGMLYFGATCTALYLFYTPVGSTMVSGVQGRYFIPISVLLIGLFTARKKVLDIKLKTLVIIILTTSIIILTTMLLRIALRYY